MGPATDETKLILCCTACSVLYKAGARSRPCTSNWVSLWPRSQALMPPAFIHHLCYEESLRIRLVLLSAVVVSLLLYLGSLKL